MKPSISGHIGQRGCSDGSGWSDRLELKIVGMLLIFVGLFVSAVRGGNLNDVAWETLSSTERDHVFVVAKGDGNKRIERLDAQGGQKVRLVGFRSLSQDQLRDKLKRIGADVVFDLGDQQLRIVAADTEVLSSIQIQLDRSDLIPTFADDFETLSLDLENDAEKSHGIWRTNFGHGPLSVHSRTLVNNAELEVYVDQLFAGTGKSSLHLNPFRVVDGNVEIVAEPLPENIRQFVWGRSYSSGLLTTKGSFSQQYGVFEIRAKLPRGKGLWPAFWLLPANNAWPPELDVFEVLGDNPRRLYASWHSNVGGIHTSDAKAIDLPDMSAGFHTYSVEWTRDTINWFFDEIQVASKPTPADFRQPMYMLVNLAVGGHWPGAPDPETVFPAIYSIDWVRAYARRGQE
jgi:hypothetical protein